LKGATYEKIGLCLFRQGGSAATTYAMPMGKLCSGRGFFGSADAVNVLNNPYFSLTTETCGSIDKLFIVYNKDSIYIQLCIDVGYFACAMKAFDHSMQRTKAANDVDLWLLLTFLLVTLPPGPLTAGFKMNYL
jgi:hypothetical protein